MTSDNTEQDFSRCPESDSMPIPVSVSEKQASHTHTQGRAGTDVPSMGTSALVQWQQEKENFLMSVEVLWKNGGLHLVPLGLNFILIRSVHNRAKRQNHKPHALTKVFPALFSALVGHWIYPMTQFVVEPWALEVFKPHQDKIHATCSNFKGSPASSRTSHNPSCPFLPNFFLSFKGKAFPLLN